MNSGVNNPKRDKINTNTGNSKILNSSYKGGQNQTYYFQDAAIRSTLENIILGKYVFQEITIYHLICGPTRKHPLHQHKTTKIKTSQISGGNIFFALGRRRGMGMGDNKEKEFLKYRWVQKSFCFHFPG